MSALGLKVIQLVGEVGERVGPSDGGHASSLGIDWTAELGQLN
jgi:hypothetical protein